MTKIFQSQQWANLNAHLNPIWVDGKLFFKTNGILYTKGDVNPNYVGIKGKFVIKMCNTEYPFFSKSNIEYIADLDNLNLSKWTRKIIRGTLRRGYEIKENFDLDEAKEVYIKEFGFLPKNWGKMKTDSKNIGVYLNGRLLGFTNYINQDNESYMLLHSIDKDNIGEGNYLLMHALFESLKKQGIRFVSCGDAANPGIANFKKKFFNEIPCWDYTNDLLRQIKWRLTK